MKLCRVLHPARASALAHPSLRHPDERRTHPRCASPHASRTHRLHTTRGAPGTFVEVLSGEPRAGELVHGSWALSLSRVHPSHGPFALPSRTGP
eukprot:6686821-Prymnesium_polylepis.1